MGVVAKSWKVWVRVRAPKPRQFCRALLSVLVGLTLRELGHCLFDIRARISLSKRTQRGETDKFVFGGWGTCRRGARAGGKESGGGGVWECARELSLDNTHKQHV
jgi:uncharacterized membrane protein YgcG